VLRQWWEGTADVGLRRAALLAIAMLRRDQPLEFLLSLIEEVVSRAGGGAIVVAARGLLRSYEPATQ
jgi:hypothetical protein